MKGTKGNKVKSVFFKSLTHFFYFFGKFLLKSYNIIAMTPIKSQRNFFIFKGNILLVSIYLIIFLFGLLGSLFLTQYYKNKKNDSLSTVSTVLPTTNSKNYFFEKAISIFFNHIHPQSLLPYTSYDMDPNKEVVSFETQISYENLIFYYLSLIYLELSRKENQKWLCLEEENLFKKINHSLKSKEERLFSLIQLSLVSLSSLKRKRDGLLKSANMLEEGSLIPVQKINIYDNVVFSIGLWLCQKKLKSHPSKKAQQLVRQIDKFLKSQHYEDVFEGWTESVELLSKEALMMLWKMIYLQDINPPKKKKKNKFLVKLTHSLYELSNHQVIPVLLTEKGTLEGISLLLLFYAFISEEFFFPFQFLLQAHYDQSTLLGDVGLFQTAFNQNGEKVDSILPSFSYKFFSTEKSPLFFFVKLDGVFSLSPFMNQDIYERWNYFLKGTLSYQHLILARSQGVSSKVLELKTLFLYFIYESPQFIESIKKKLASHISIVQMNQQLKKLFQDHFSNFSNLELDSIISFSSSSSQKKIKEPLKSNNFYQWSHLNVISSFQFSSLFFLEGMSYQGDKNKIKIEWNETFYQNSLNVKNGTWIDVLTLKETEMRRRIHSPCSLEVSLLSSSFLKVRIEIQNHYTNLSEPVEIDLLPFKKVDIKVGLFLNPWTHKLPFNCLKVSIQKRDNFEKEGSLSLEKIYLKIK